MKKWADQEISEFHAHVYFQESTQASALLLYERIGELFAAVHRNPVAYGPRGPHVQNMFGLDIPKSSLPDLLEFLILNHGRHSILFHPVTANELMDHTHHALWLGPPQPLDLSILG